MQQIVTRVFREGVRSKIVQWMFLIVHASLTLIQPLLVTINSGGMLQNQVKTQSSFIKS